MRNECVAGLFTLAVVMVLSGCRAGNYPEPVPPVTVNRTYEKVDPSPAVVADLCIAADAERCPGIYAQVQYLLVYS